MSTHWRRRDTGPSLTARGWLALFTIIAAFSCLTGYLFAMWAGITP